MRSAFALAIVLSSAAVAQDPTPYYLQDRGAGIPTSLFGTYIKDGELLVYPFFEYQTNGAEEYKPSEFGAVGDQDFLGQSSEHEAVIFFGYGLTESLALEFESEVWKSATFDTAAADTSALPDRLEESGFAGAEAQLRWLWRQETATRPAFYSFFEVEFPFQKDKALIGVSDWEYAVGTGVIRGFRWGTINGRLSVAYEAAEAEVELGEYAIEYLKRVSERWRFVATVEGEDDELMLIGEAQWFITPNIFLKLNNAVGITDKAPDWAPEVGVMFSF